MENSTEKFTGLSRKLKRLGKSFVALSLCVCLVIGYSYRKPQKVEAAVTAATVAGCVLVAAAVTALGIGVSASMNNESYTQACNNIWNNISDHVKAGVMVTQGVGSVIKAQLTSAFLHAVSTGLAKEYPSSYQWGQYFNRDVICEKLGWNANVYDTRSGNYGLGFFLNSHPNMTNPYLVQTMQLSDSMSFPVGPITVSYDDGTLFTKSVTGILIDYFDCGSYVGTNRQAAIVACNYGSSYAYFLLVNDSEGDGICVFPDTGTQIAAPPAPDVYNPADNRFYADGYSVMNHKVDDVISKVGALQGTTDGVIAYLPDIVGSLTSIQDQIKSLTQSKVTDVDATNTAEKAANDTTNKGRDTTVPKDPSMPDLTLPTGLQKKFPFCLPWDLAALYGMFQVTPKAPSWDVPINIDQGLIHVHRTYKFDMNSNGVMDGFLPVFKWFLNLAEVVGLIFLFKKIVQ